VPELEIVVYTSSFCGACTATLDRVRTAGELVGDRLAWREVNVAAHPEEAEARAIEATPTVVLVRPDGGEAMRAEGVPSLDQVLAAVAAHLPDRPGA